MHFTQVNTFSSHLTESMGWKPQMIFMANLANVSTFGQIGSGLIVEHTNRKQTTHAIRHIKHRIYARKIG